MDTKLKKRLIGAVVLIALAVIFLPMLVKGPAPDSGASNVSIDVPKAPEPGEYETRELPLVAPPDAVAEGEASDIPSSTSVSNLDAADLAEPAQEAREVEQTLPGTTPDGDWAVSFGAYASTQDADAMVQRLRRAGLPGFIVPDQLNGKPAWRVRVGPYADQSQAEIIRLKAVQVRGDVNAQVIALNADASTESGPSTLTRPATPPSTAKPERTETAKAPQPAVPPAVKASDISKPAPGASGVGFAVQLAAYSRQSEADALCDKLRGAGFSAFVEPVNTDKGTLIRVKAGPVSDRTAADALKAQIAAKLGLNGIVRSHP